MSVTKVPSTATCPCHRRRLFSSYSPSPNIKYSTILKLSAAAKTSLTTNHSSSSRQKENHFLKLVNRSCKVGSYDEALYFLECMASQGHRPGTVFCTKLIRGFLKASMIEKGERVMEILERHGTPDTISYNVLAAGTLASLSDYSCGEFLKRMGKHGCSPDTVTYNTLIGALCAGDQLSPAFELLDRMMMGDDHRPTITTYMILVETAVRSYAGGGGSGTLSTSFVTLLLDRIPSEEAYNAVLRRMCREGLVDGAWEILHKSLLLQSHSYCRPSVKSCNILLRGLLDQRRWEDAEKLVSEMVSPSTDIQQPDIVTYNIMISSLCREGMPEKAVTVLKDMMAAGMKPIAGTYNNFDPLVSSYCKQGRTDLAVKFINYIAVNYSGRYVLDILNYNTILSSLCKSGEIDEAMKIFDGLESAGCAPNTSTYNAMIGGLWNNGRKQIAVEMVGNMMNRGVEFDDVTYNVLISCLCRDGMVDSAVRLMRDMEQSNGFRPNVITYNSLILGFCKSQRVELAVDVFTEMVEMRRCLPNQSTYVILVEGVAYAGHRGTAVMLGNALFQRNLISIDSVGRLKKTISPTRKND
ncbi:putative Pentatricopeptide repeat-containing protein [Zostera marina]|uniref:Putative Pentatricopeptide repeat-containing protein n=1 Tax=Zostera marina TaxID=29655 RepID=A0A0K9PIJ8_ZOSMR|nr:putative Pentatricopeptide repeat-containing protein [Zostera marina]